MRETRDARNGHTSIIAPEAVLLPNCHLHLRTALRATMHDSRNSDIQDVIACKAHEAPAAIAETTSVFSDGMHQVSQLGYTGSVVAQYL